MWWEGGGVRCVVRGVEGCGRGRGVWCEEWRCVGRVGECGGKGGGVWKGWRSVVGGVEVCGRVGECDRRG